MKALTLWQPWASLIAVGAKTIETRSWSTKYRGPLAIHAAKRKPWTELLEDGWAGELYDDDLTALDSCVAQWYETTEEDYAPERLPIPEMRWSLALAPEYMPVTMPLGAIVATCNLVDVVETRDVHWVTNCALPGGNWARGTGSCVASEREKPCGDYSPGRFAWLLDNIVPADEPIPWKGAQGLWEWRS